MLFDLLWQTPLFGDFFGNLGDAGLEIYSVPVNTKMFVEIGQALPDLFASQEERSINMRREIRVTEC